MNRVKSALYNAGLYYWSAWVHTSDDEKAKHYFDRYTTIYAVIEDAGLENDFERWKEIQAV